VSISVGKKKGNVGNEADGWLAPLVGNFRPQFVKRKFDDEKDLPSKEIR